MAKETHVLWGFKEGIGITYPIKLTKGTLKHCREESELYRKAGWYVGSQQEPNTMPDVVLADAQGDSLLMNKITKKAN